jgi:DNA-binding response OmpR family regulator
MQSSGDNQSDRSAAREGAPALPLVLCIDPLFDRFALATRRLGEHWRLGWADSPELMATWFRTHQPAVVVFFFLDPGPRSLQLVQAVRAKTRAPILVHLAREEPAFRVSLQLAVDDIAVGPLSFPALDERLRQLVSPLQS